MAKQILGHRSVQKSMVATTLMLNMVMVPMISSAEEASDEIIEEVVVTGSRIATSNETSSQPLLSISSDALVNSGQFDLSEVLNDTPSLTSSISATNSLDDPASNVDASASNNFGGAALDLRGLGYKRTLTLVNGRRHVAGIEGTASVDITTIPAALVDRVDVLSGGASAVYGSDALTGVVNFVLKEDFEGLEFSLQAGADQYMDNSKNRLSLVGGRNFADGRGNITFALQVDQDNGLLMGDRGFLADQNIYSDGNNPALRFQKGDISSGTTPALSQYYNYGNTGLYPWGLRIPSQEAFAENYEAEFGSAPTLNAAEAALFAQAAAAPPRALLPGYTFSITSPYGVVALGDFPLAGTDKFNAKIGKVILADYIVFPYMFIPPAGHCKRLGTIWE